ncbi:MAG TPA: DUF4331 domain-containing protein [Actinomycetota bacterium]|nr:DUF4331 domain-containing protein [Actinomycetota bacterium]
MTLKRFRSAAVAAVSAILGVAAYTGLAPVPGGTASHREAPLISLDPAADITDFFMFRSYEPGKDDKVVMIMNVFPGGEPSSGPNYLTFDQNVLYAFYVDNDMDGKANDVRFEFRFKSEVRGLVDQFDLFVSYLGCGPRDLPCATPLPPITALDGPGSEGLGLRQKYTVAMVRNGHREQLGEGLIAVPSNVGPSTTPTYDSLADQGVYTLDSGIRTFAGQRSDPFYIDLGAVFDTLNLRRLPPLLTPAEDANDDVNPFGIDSIGTFNVQTIALEVPASLLTVDGMGPDETESSKLGSYAATSRPKVTVLRVPKSEDDDRGDVESGKWVQVQRLANPLINETIIGTEDKDFWNALRPQKEEAFLDYYLNPRLALALQLIFGVPAETTGRQDLVDLLLKYQAADEQLSELLRLDISVAPTALAAQRRMTVLATPADPAGWPNGRRPRDDVLDIAVRVVGGPNYVAARAGDGVNRNFRPLSGEFPFLATPQNGRDRVHENPAP